MSEDHRVALRQILNETKKNYPGLADDKVFELFASEQTLKQRLIELDPDELRDGVIGGGGDGGIDGLFLFINRRLVREDTDLSEFPTDGPLAIDLFVIQASQQGGFSESAITKFADFSKHCLRLTADHDLVRSMYRASLLVKVEKFRKIYGDNLHRRPTTTLRFYYATQGDQVDPKAEFKRSQFLEDMSTYFIGVDCDMEFVGSQSLLQWFYRQIETTLILPMVESGSAYSKHPAASYVGFVKLRDFNKFITDESGALREHLFESNVRHFQGFTKVNKEIQAALRDHEPTLDFWWLNNGVTVVASEIAGDRELLSVTEPLIVNGLQTSFVIHDYFRSNAAAQTDDRMVMVRVVKAVDAATVDAIIKATNSQTYLPPSYLHATEDIHRNIETVLRGKDLYYERRKGYYRRRGIEPSKIVTLPSLAQAVVAIVLRRPTDARGRPTSATARDYQKIFPKGGGIEIYVQCAQAMKRVEHFLDGEIQSQATVNNLRFYVAMVAVCQLLRNATPRRDTIANMDASQLTDQVLRQSLFLVNAEFTKLGANDTTAKGPELLRQIELQLAASYPKPRRHK